MDDIYREEIIEHYKNPLNYGKITGADIDKEDSNPLCGDSQRIMIKLNDKKRIQNISFTGKGCAISIATASILTEHFKGKQLSEVNLMTREELLDLIGLNLTPTRVKCAMLPLITMKKGIIEYESKSLAKKNIVSAISEIKKKNIIIKNKKLKIKIAKKRIKKTKKKHEKQKKR